MEVHVSEQRLKKNFVMCNQVRIEDWRMTYSRAPERYQVDVEWKEEVVQSWKGMKLQSAVKLGPASRTQS
jgi:hypothetical protein